MKKLIVALLILAAGCHSDNRIRTKPVLDYKIDPAQKETYRLHFMREIWAETRLKADEKAYDLTGND